MKSHHDIRLQGALTLRLMQGMTLRQQLAFIPHVEITQLANICQRDFADYVSQLIGKTSCPILQGIDLSRVQLPSQDIIAANLQAVQGANIQVVFYAQANYPELLMHIASPPVCLFCIGDISLLSRKQIAIVGSRHASANGAQSAFDFAAALSEQDWVVTSGMALGIDAMAHSGALAVNGRTIAVLGTGVDVLYPKRHAQLYEALARQGLIISEFLPGTAPLKTNFPRRNRIIAGMTIATLVVEAGIRSGSLITARLAADFGRDVFAMPGSVHSARSKGCHQLIRQGAVLVENVDDIFAEIETFYTPFGSNIAQNSENSAAQAIKGVAKQVYELIDYEPTDIDVLVRQCNLSFEQLMQILLELELAGLIIASSGTYQRMLT